MPNNNTCYNKFYYSRYYDDSVFWKLDNEGVLTIWGNGKIDSGGSRVPWGSYKDLIKKIVVNDEKVGIVTKTNKDNSANKLEGAVYAIYSNKPVSEIMNNKIKIVDDVLIFV